MIVTGAKSLEDSVNASKKYVSIINKVGFSARFTDYKIQNILDTTQEYTFTIFDTPGVSANAIFNIRNRDYMPISLEHEVNITGFGKKVTGKFYAFK